ncbi:hypothetical protein GOV06_03915 [Candidatus Woesearchaeota archaeon]|nr:hypothetical protein [Candidatus Woesearchaeota archaeon]
MKTFYIYLANPLGFSLELEKPALDNLIGLLEGVQVEGIEVKVIEPFAENEKYLPQITPNESYKEHERKWDEFNDQVYENNKQLMAQSHMMVAILNGADVDSGVASEVAKYSLAGKPVIGYRDDFRLGENIASRGINLEVKGSVKEAIKKSGGQIVGGLDHLVKTATEYVRKIAA